MQTFRITLAYDGTGFVGWQRQASGASLQGVLEDRLRELDQRDVRVTGAGRTDAGVHALGQVASFSLEREIAPDVLMRALNARLPDTVRVVAASEGPAAFHARFGALAKTYRYRLWNGEVLNPFERQFAWHITCPLDVEAMAAAVRLLEGSHDFAAFQAAGTSTRATEREVFSSRVITTEHSEELEGGLIVYEISGNGFLRHMVRNIVGTMVEVGRGRRKAGWMQEVLASRDRGRAGPTAPPVGLFLVRVDYETNALASHP